MFKLFAIMISGVVVGYFLRRRSLTALPKAITLLIWALLFLLGLKVGHNRQLIAALPTLGVEALVIASCALLGSLFLAWLLWTIVNAKSHQKL
jgi:uncharacterized membrane protein YbjE (DUF340 family)